MVGESPCTTYERLRQICNPPFQVGTMSTNTPSDACDEQVADCCCNSVAFTLSMLCLNCQQGTGSSGNGYDAGQGAYQLYLQGSRSPGQWCSPVVNTSLPNNIDTAVCDRGIKIIDDIRTGLFWADGSWFYRWSYEAISKDVSVNDGNAFTHCASSSTSTSRTATSSSTTPTFTSSNTVTVEAQAPGASSHSNSSSNTLASGILSTSYVTGIFPSGITTVLAGTTHVVIAPSSNSDSGSSPLPTASGNTNGSDQTLLTSSRMSKGMIGGIAGAAVVAICALSAFWFFCRLRKGKKTATIHKPDDVEPFADRQPSWSTSGSESSTPFLLRPQKLELENLARPRTHSQLTLFHHNGWENDNLRYSESYSGVMNQQAMSPLSPQRHADAGPVQVSMMGRRMSESLPPAYGEQIS
ncbi:hypothetical protein J3R30DRAFT_2710515 [Lentinula aciculospora]|uniref:Uncharacterized protein n=1 Tax=Lentinula aciculospora TaxID=153920 RepID=A0A9W9ABQ6_9AGAR|nr:hypothetical protein J3R30DRAFT_2710515 [Lentinula aciculospora]